VWIPETTWARYSSAAKVRKAVVVKFRLARHHWIPREGVTFSVGYVYVRCAGFHVSQLGVNAEDVFRNRVDAERALMIQVMEP
jgi:hypothetical protein